ncbi:MAG: RICIN domain-containing protein [Labedaea sp.]
MNTRRFRSKIASLIGLAAAVIGIMLATPAAAPASIGPFFEIVNPVFGGCADVINASTSAGALVQEFHCKNNDAQLWEPQLQTDQVRVKLLNRGSGLCLHAGSGVNGAPVDQQSCDNTDQGVFWQWGLADRFGHLVLVSDFPGKCLSLASATRTDGTRMIIADCATTATQFFRIDN